MEIRSGNEVTAVSDMGSLIKRSMDNMEGKGGYLNTNDGVAIYFNRNKIVEAIASGETKILFNLIRMRHMSLGRGAQRDFLERTIERCIPIMEENMDDELVARSVLYLYGDSEDELKSQMGGLVETNYDRLSKKAESEYLIKLLFVDYQIDRAGVDDEIGLDCRKQVLDIFEENGGLGEVLRNYFRDFMSLDRDQVEVKMRNVVNLLGLDRKMCGDMVKSWSTYQWEKKPHGAGTGEYFRNMMVGNINRLKALKKKGGEAVIKKLYEDYGITHFGRYPLEILLDQANEEAGPYGIWLGAYSDHNGAFDGDKSFRGIDEFNLECGELGYGLKIVEARDKLSVIRRLMYLDKKFGNKNKISFVVVNGHGERTRVDLGKGSDGSMAVDDLSSKSAEVIKMVYDSKVIFLFNSCTTGHKQGGLARRYSIYTGRQSVGPDRPSGETQIHLKKKLNGELYFDVEYGGHKKPKAIYFEGGVDKTKGIDDLRRETREMEFGRMIGDPVMMKQTWERQYKGSFSILLGILSKSKLMPLRDRLKRDFGESNIKIGFGLADDRKRQLIEGARLEKVCLASVNEDRLNVVFGIGTDEGFGRLASLAYNHIRGRDNLLVFAEVEGEVGGEIVKRRYPVDLRDLYPENIEKTNK